MPLEVAYQSHPGQKRSYNQDAALVLRLDTVGEHAGPQTVLCVLADGMGGHTDGGVASTMAIRAIAAGVLNGWQNAPLEGWQASSQEQLVEILQEAIVGAGARINQAAQYGMADMGTTAVCGLFLGDHVLLGNVGDSRCYLLHEDLIQQITVDHSLVERLVQQGELTPEQARVHPRRNEIYRMLGLGRQPEPDFFWLEIQPGDTLLFCSDGLNTMVEDHVIAAIVREAPTLATAADQLIEAANAGGGDDNVTVILVRVLEGVAGQP